MPNGVIPAAFSFFASARNSAQVSGPLLGFRPAFLNRALFQRNGMPSRYWGIAQSLPPDTFSAVPIQFLVSLAGTKSEIGTEAPFQAGVRTGRVAHCVAMSGPLLVCAAVVKADVS